MLQVQSLFDVWLDLVYLNFISVVWTFQVKSVFINLASDHNRSYDTEQVWVVVFNPQRLTLQLPDLSAAGSSDVSVWSCKVCRDSLNKLHVTQTDVFNVFNCMWAGISCVWRVGVCLWASSWSVFSLSTDGWSLCNRSEAIWAANRNTNRDGL